MVIADKEAGFSPHPHPQTVAEGEKQNTDHAGDGALHKTYVKREWHCLWWKLQGHSGAFFIQKKKRKKSAEPNMEITLTWRVIIVERACIFVLRAFR